MDQDDDVIMAEVDSQDSSTDSQRQRYLKLNDDILYHIFQYLPVADKKNCSRVHKSWNRVIKSPKLAENMIWTFDVDYIFENLSKFFNTWYQRKPNLYHVELKSQCTGDDLNPKDVEFLYKILQDLCGATKILTFTGCRNYIGNLSVFPNLQVLNIEKLAHLKGIEDISGSLQSIHVRVLSNKVEPEVLEILRNLPSLNKISAHHLGHFCDNCKERQSHLVELFPLAPQLVNALEHNTCPTVGLNVWYNWKYGIPLELNQVKINGSMGICGAPESTSFNKILQLKSNDLLNVAMFHLNPVINCWFQHKVIPFPNLRGCIIQSDAGVACKLCIEYFLKSCTNVKKFELRDAAVRYLKKILNLKKKVDQLIIDFDYPFPLADFVNSNRNLTYNMFENLEHLEISFSATDESDFRKWPAMPKLKTIHLKLDCLDFVDCILVKCPELRNVLLFSERRLFKLIVLKRCIEKLPYLKVLVITCKGYRFPPDDLLKLYPNFPELRTLKIKGTKFYTLENNLLRSVSPDVNLEQKMAYAVPTLREVDIDD